MARDFNGTTQYGHQDTAPITAYPLSVSAWFNADTSPGTGYILCQPVGKNGSDGAQILYLGPTKVRAFSSDGAGASGQAETTVTWSTGTWTHAAAVFTNSTSRAAFINGGNKATNATAVNMVASPDRMAIGAQYALAGVPTNPLDGKLAEVGIWNVALDDAEVASLGAGYSPLLIRPASLIAYYPLFGRLSPEPDGWRSKLDMTLVASPPQFDHYKFIYPDNVRTSS